LSSSLNHGGGSFIKISSDGVTVTASLSLTSGRANAGSTRARPSNHWALSCLRRTHQAQCALVFVRVPPRPPAKGRRYRPSAARSSPEIGTGKSCSERRGTTGSARMSHGRPGPSTASGTRLQLRGCSASRKRTSTAVFGSLPHSHGQDTRPALGLFPATSWRGAMTAKSHGLSSPTCVILDARVRSTVTAINMRSPCLTQPESGSRKITHFHAIFIFSLLPQEQESPDAFDTRKERFRFETV